MFKIVWIFLETCITSKYDHVIQFECKLSNVTAVIYNFDKEIVSPMVQPIGLESIEDAEVYQM